MNMKKLIIPVLLVLIVLTALSFILMGIFNLHRIRLIFFTFHLVLYVYTIIFFVFFSIVSIFVWTLSPHTTKDRLALNIEPVSYCFFYQLITIDSLALDQQSLSI